MIRIRDVFKERDFSLLWFGQIISNFGDRLNQMALVALVYQRSPGSEMALAKLIAFTIIPVFAIGPIAGAWVDRLNRKHVMIASDILRGALVALVPLFIAIRQLGVVYAIIFLTFSISRFFIPSKMAIIPEIVPQEKLLLANTLQGTTNMIGNVVGLVVAGLIVNIPSVGAVGGFYIDAGTFFISAALISLITHRWAKRELLDELKITEELFGKSLRTSLFREVADGMRCIAGNRGVLFAAVTFFALMSALGAISCVIIVFIQDAFGSATKHLGLLGMALVAGLFLGTVAFGKYGQRLRRTTAILSSFAATGAALMAFTAGTSAAANVFLGGALAALVGAAVSPVMASVTTLVQESVPADARGRIFSSMEIVIHAAFLGAMFAAAVASRHAGRVGILMGVGMMLAAGGGAGLVWKGRATTTSV